MNQIIVDKLKMHKTIDKSECFCIIKEISQSFSSENEVEIQKGRDLLILVLDNWDNTAQESKGVFLELIESAGFYPYLEKIGMNINEFDCMVRKGFHQSNYLEDKVFHSEQKKIVDLIHSGKSLVVSAPTSFGKSLLIEEIIASNKFENIIIIQPTLALLDETRNKLKKYSNNYKIIVRTTQEKAEGKGNIFLLTAERVLEYQNLPPISLFILDEFYKLSNQRKDNRSNILNNAFIKIIKNNPTCQFYFLGPNIDSISLGFAEKYNATFVKTNYSMVATEVDNQYENVSTKRGGKVEENCIFEMLDSVEGQTLVFCSSPSTARKLAFAYYAHLNQKGIETQLDLPLGKWIEENISYNWSLKNCLEYGIGIHDGAMPKHIVSSTIRYFNSGNIEYLFCTNTIIEGVNTSAKNVIYYDNKIGTRPVDYFDYANIRGRAGRLMEHYVGRVINLKKPPEEVKISIDLPFYDQNPIDEEVLVNLPEADVKDIADNTEKYEKFHSMDLELQEILIRNGVSIQGQKNILKVIEEDLQDYEKRNLIVWNTIDSQLYKRMQYIIKLCWENLPSAEEKRTYGAQGQIINKIVSCCYQTSISESIEKDIEYRCKKFIEQRNIKSTTVSQLQEMYPKEVQTIIDGVIEHVFAIQKNWFQYRAPKWINIVDSLQKYACAKLGINAGDYSYVAEMIENNFVHASLRVLFEYGVPTPTIEKIQGLLVRHHVNLEASDEDKILSIIRRNLDTILLSMTEYEKEILQIVL
ncbi:DEAD/DEAH box helicase [Robinsoniella sp. KNHs210]|uniref:DEAD/DEAH box helicase n=1 Tax=Robinsoniella sp. KNHs210 TaxID=1469950 RepID=UPI0004898E99|nr:DEAD/DEAH box helicase [Robinsoniella sp. KNHs210]